VQRKSELASAAVERNHDLISFDY